MLRIFALCRRRHFGAEQNSTKSPKGQANFAPNNPPGGHVGPSYKNKKYLLTTGRLPSRHH